MITAIVPGYIRLYAATDDTPAGRVALEYTKALVRIAPVRVLGVGEMPTFLGPWRGLEHLMLTPTHGTYVNVVATLPERWTWKMSIRAPRADGSTEIISDQVELWTASVRNVLLAMHTPMGKHQIATAAKYDAIVVPRRDLATWVAERLARSCHVIETPVDPDRGYQTLRSAILG